MSLYFSTTIISFVSFNYQISVVQREREWNGSRILVLKVHIYDCKKIFIRLNVYIEIKIFVSWINAHGKVINIKQTRLWN
jgi:hypothetical protein